MILEWAISFLVYRLIGMARQQEIMEVGLVLLR